MFCPDCGTENSRSQKFCTRCGSNLIALEHARTIVGEVAGGNSSNQLSSAAVLKIVAFISIFGIFFVTAGTIALLVIEAASTGRIHTPISIFFGLGGLFTIAMICRYLLNLVKSAPKSDVQFSKVAQAQPLKATTNRSLAEAQPYFSVTEQNTQQFEPQRRTNQ
ncbi:MAG TPA: zinc ribbon domain-containing protein [Blastocatellia bacterium]|nr:zinc ribbon domain-containing protein [Blastocatellia bacterium]